MCIYNHQKINQLKQALNLTSFSDEMCLEYLAHENLSQSKWFKSLSIKVGAGASRTAYNIIGTDLVIKQTHDFQEFLPISQGKMEKITYENCKGSPHCLDIYGFSEDCSLVVCELLKNANSPSNWSEELIQKVVDFSGCAREDFLATFNCYCCENNLPESWGLNDFEDLAISNLGFDNCGVLKILDLGLGIIE